MHRPASILFTVVLSLIAPGLCQAQIGPAPLGQTLARYFPATGSFYISANDVAYWYIHSATDSFVAMNLVLPGIPGANALNNPARIGQSQFGPPLIYVNHHL